MRSMLVLAAVIFLLSLPGLPGLSQVAPAAQSVSGLPIGVGAGLTDYSLDYGQDRRMLGASVWGDYSIWHGLAVEAEGTFIFADRPSSISRMQQNTVKGGLIYKYNTVFRVRPYVKGAIGLGSIDFPSRNPFYTHDTYTMYAFGAGLEYQAGRRVYLRGDYEYQLWQNFQGRNTLNPNGFTLGATYYFRGIHRHS